MPEMSVWLMIYESANHKVKLRAARAILLRFEDAPISTLLDILDHLSHEGLGAATEAALLARSDPAVGTAMLSRLHASDAFVREVACRVLGQVGDSRESSRLLELVNDRDVMVSRAALSALARLGEKSLLPELRLRLSNCRLDDPLRFPLEYAVRALEGNPQGHN